MSGLDEMFQGFEAEFVLDAGSYNRTTLCEEQGRSEPSNAYEAHLQASLLKFLSISLSNKDIPPTLSLSLENSLQHGSMVWMQGVLQAREGFQSCFRPNWSQDKPTLCSICTRGNRLDGVVGPSSE